jgi:hypothetical protein
MKGRSLRLVKRSIRFALLPLLFLVALFVLAFLDDGKPLTSFPLQLN